MDPITAMILAMAIAGITGRFIGGGVAEAAAAVKGKPSPAAQKWEAREKARQARGERAEHKPGLFRVLWDNAIEERTQRAAARHVGRMEALREMAGEEQAKAREKLLRKAQRRAAVAEKVAGLGNQSWGHARRLAGDTAAVINERRAERAARRDETPTAGVDVDVAEPAPAPENTEDEVVEDEGVVHEPVEGEAEVIPFRRKEPSAAAKLQQEIEEARAERERVAAAAGTNASPTPTMYSDWRRAQGREARTEQELRERFGPATEADLKATQTRGSFRVIPQWRDANSIWQMWHQGDISTQQLHQELLRDSGIDPRLAAELGMTAADLSLYAGQANACLETDEVYTPPSEAELRAKFGHRVAAEPQERTTGQQGAVTAEDLESEEILDPRSAAIKVTQVRGQYRRIDGWGEANTIWRRWHDGEITAAERDAELAAAAGIEPQLATELEMTPAALSEYAGRDGSVSEAELRATYEVPWHDDEQIWADWKKGNITAAERDAELAQFAGVDPHLAAELEIPSEDVAEMARAANGAFWTTPSEYDLRLQYKPTKLQLELEEHRRAQRAAWAARQAEIETDAHGEQPSPSELLRQQQAAGENGPGDPAPEHENTVEGNPDMTSATAQTTTVPEIADLATGIEYTTTIGRHFTDLGAKLAEDADVVGNNAEAFDSQVGVIEAGQAALAAQGFGGVIQSSFDEVAEKLPSAAAKLRQIQTLLAEVGEEITGAASSMQSAKTALEDQRGLAEQVQAQSSSNGVARDTAFYQEA